MHFSLFAAAPSSRSISPSLSLPLSLAALLVLFQSSLLNLCVGRANRRYRLSISLHLAHVHSICGNISDCSPPTTAAAANDSEGPLQSHSLVIVHLRLILFKYSIRNQAEINRIFGPSPLPRSSPSFVPPSICSNLKRRRYRPSGRSPFN